MTDRELLAQCYDTMSILYIPDTPLMKALRARLAQPEKPDYSKAGFGTAPPQREWVGLTDEEIWSDGSTMGLSENGIRNFARAIEIKLKEKNG